MESIKTFPIGIAVFAGLAVCSGESDSDANPASSSSSASAPANANACFNPKLYVSGTTYEYAYALSGRATGSFKSVATVSQPASYHGYGGLVAVQETAVYTLTAPAAISYTTKSTRYFGPPTTMGIRNYGATVDNSTSPGAMSVQTYSPPWDDPLSILTIHQSVTASFGFVVNTAAATPKSETFTFVGMENMSVPAGNFMAACHFRTSTTVGTSAAVVVDAWVSGGTGFVLKVSGAGVQQLLNSATINGTPIR